MITDPCCTAVLGTLLSGILNKKNKLHVIWSIKLISEKFWVTKEKVQFINMILLVLFSQWTCRPSKKTWLGQREVGHLSKDLFLCCPSCGRTVDAAQQTWSNRRPMLPSPHIAVALWVWCREKCVWRRKGRARPVPQYTQGSNEKQPEQDGLASCLIPFSGMAVKQLKFAEEGAFLAWMCNSYGWWAPK